MNDLSDALESCLRELEDGAELELVLRRFPQHAGALRPLIDAAMQARSLSGANPASDSTRRARAKILQRAAEMRERKAAPLRSQRRAIPGLQRLALALGMTSVLLISATGLVRASSSALPGENLYPVKRSWEGVQLFLAFQADQRISLTGEFENERLREVSDLISEGRAEPIQFSGVFTQLNGKSYVSGVPIIITSNTRLPSGAPQDGNAVLLSGYTNADGVVQAESIEVLPAGSVVPVGGPVEPDSESSAGSQSDSGPADEPNNSSKPAPGSGSGEASFQIQGRVDSVSNDSITLNGQRLAIKGAQVSGKLKAGANVEVEGFYSATGQFIVTQIKVDDKSSSGGDGGNPSGPGSGDSGGGDGGGHDPGGGSGVDGG